MRIKRRKNIYRILTHWEAPVEQPTGTKTRVPHPLRIRGKSKLTIISTEIFHEKWPSVLFLQVRIVCIQTSRRRVIHTVRRCQPQTETVKSWGPRLPPRDQIRDSKTRTHLQLSTIIAKSQKITPILVILPLFMATTWCISLNQQTLMLRTRLIRKVPLSVRWHRDSLKCQTRSIVLTWSQHIRLQTNTASASKVLTWTIKLPLKTTSLKATVPSHKTKSSK